MCPHDLIQVVPAPCPTGLLRKQYCDFLSASSQEAPDVSCPLLVVVILTTWLRRCLQDFST